MWPLSGSVRGGTDGTGSGESAAERPIAQITAATAIPMMTTAIVAARGRHRVHGGRIEFAAAGGSWSGIVKRTVSAVVGFGSRP